MKLSGFIIALLPVFLEWPLKGIEKDSVTLNQPAFTFLAIYTGDNVINLAGGLKSGYGYLGLANFCLSFSTANAGLWEGGGFFIRAANTHGATPSVDLIGDLQVASNIEAGDHTYI